ncbi:MAG: hypothetical protein IH852_11650 [Bacteroidetes bacterium]|nr:hypothetical protein [Bacteroidota bacterium]
MKTKIIDSLRNYKDDLSTLKREIGKLDTKRVSRKELRESAEKLASRWVEELRSPLEHKYKIDKSIIEVTSELMKKLHVLSRPNNQKSSYIRCINQILKDFDNKFILPILQVTSEVHEISELQKILMEIIDQNESDYLAEAISCAQSGYYKAAVVMGWCAAIARIQRKIMAIGFDKFNKTSQNIKSQTSGKFKRWNKEFNVTTLSELQTIFDRDLVVILEGMGLIDGNQAQRLETCFQYRNHSAHPGEAPVEPVHAVSFFVDINKIILNNANFSLS